MQQTEKKEQEEQLYTVIGASLGSLFACLCLLMSSCWGGDVGRGYHSSLLVLVAHILRRVSCKKEHLVELSTSKFHLGLDALLQTNSKLPALRVLSSIEHRVQLDGNAE